MAEMPMFSESENRLGVPVKKVVVEDLANLPTPATDMLRFAPKGVFLGSSKFSIVA